MQTDLIQSQICLKGLSCGNDKTLCLHLEKTSTLTGNFSDLFYKRTIHLMKGGADILRAAAGVEGGGLTALMCPSAF